MAIVTAAVFLGLLATYASFHQSRDWNTASRALLTVALVQDRTIEVTRYVTLNGELVEHPLTRDLAVREGHYFCDKAPGHSFLGIPANWLAREAGAPSLPDSVPATTVWPTEFWITLGSSGVVTAATAALIVVFVACLGTGLGTGLSAAAVSGLAYGLATTAFPYGTLNYGHVTAGFFLLVSAYCLTQGTPNRLAYLFAGLAASAATVTEYTAVVFPLAATVALALADWSRERNATARGWMWFVLGGLPLAFLLAWYHHVVTGSMFRVPYTMEVEEEIFGYHKEGYGIPVSAPRLEVARELLFGVRRGLVWYSPVLLGAVPGIWQLARRGQRRLAFLCAATFLGLFGINAGFPTWDGGWATGPRFLIPSFPLLMVATGFWLGSPAMPGWRAAVHFLLRGAWVLAAAYGLGVMFVFTLAGARIPPAVPAPILEIVPRIGAPYPGENHLGVWVTNGLSWEAAPRAVIVGLTAAVPLAAVLSTHLLIRRARRR